MVGDFTTAKDLSRAARRANVFPGFDFAPRRGLTRLGLGAAFSLTLISLTVASLFAPKLSAAEKPRNVVVLLADDWRFDTLGCAGNPVVQTPRLDQLAKQGVRFEHACVTTSICGVSRATLFTGQWMSRHGCQAFTAFQTPFAETYPGILRANGWFTGHVGKWHNGKFPAEEFDVGKSYMGTHWIKQPGGERVHVTQKNERDAIAFLRERRSEKPFCMTVAFFAPHAEDGNPKQYLFQPESAELYRDVKIPVPPTATDEHFHKLPPFIANDKNEGRNRWKWRFDTPEKYQEYMKAYYRLVTEVDTACGRILDELRAQRLDESTLVIFTGDNGYFHAEHGLADKWYPYEESIRVPLIVRDPRLPPERRGMTNDDFALNVDLAPTILAFAGQKIPEGMQGADLSPLYLAAEKPLWRQEFFYEHGTIRNKDFIPSSEAIVRKDAKFIRWPEFETEEFFDLNTDPREENNRIADPAVQAAVAELRTRFQELQAAAK